MHLLMITGFLGSGKTTLLLKLAETARDKGRKTAILVNEAGEIGIDNQLMRQLGFNVWELVGGCICCSLAGDVIGTLERVEKDFQPDLVLLEPTGAADPRNLMNILASWRGRPFSSLIKAALLDPLRLRMLMEVASPLITAAMDQADLILINKADIASAEELQYARETALEHGPENRIFSLAAREGLKPELKKELLPWMA